MRGRIRSAFVTFAVTAVWFAAPAAAQSIQFDTSGLPSSPTTFEEQKLWDSIVTAGGHPSLAPQTHLQLADYYDRHGKSTLAAKERDAAGGVAPAATPASPSAPASPPAPAALASSADPTDATAFDLSASPATPASFEEQRIRESLSDPHTLTNPSLLAFAHRQLLGRYYASQGRVDLAGTEYARAIVAEPTDPNGYRGLAALHEATGSDPSDGTNSLRDISQALDRRRLSNTSSPEPEPAVAPSASSSHWQETSAEFNRRMNSLYSSNAWSGVYRTVFSGGLYP